MSKQDGIIKSTVAKMMRDANQTGQLQQSGDWGDMEKRRHIAIWKDGDQWNIELNACGNEATIEQGTDQDIYSHAVDFLRNAG